MTENEMKLIQQEEQRLRDEASAHASRGMAATDEVIRRVELHQYDINQFAAVNLYHLQRLLQVTSEDPAVAPGRNAAVSPTPLINENMRGIFCIAIKACRQYAKNQAEAGDQSEVYACCVAVRALKDIMLSLSTTPAK